jgi:hypothetical protein
VAKGQRITLASQKLHKSQATLYLSPSSFGTHENLKLVQTQIFVINQLFPFTVRVLNAAHFENRQVALLSTFLKCFS